jgi:catechol 2,3-dioxygenase-like lactoylglutathione lyase family enzyme
MLGRLLRGVAAMTHGHLFHDLERLARYHDLEPVYCSRGLLPLPAGNEQTVTDNPRQMPRIFGVYLQVADLNRSLSFYRDVLALKVDWNDGELAVLHGPVESADTLVLRQIGDDARHDLGEAGVTRVFLHVRDSADLDRAEDCLTREEVRYHRHRDTSAEGIGVRDPDGLEIVLLWIREKVPAKAPPAWLYWYH